MADPDRDPHNAWGFILTICIGIALTVVAVPVLLLATCIPLMAGHADGIKMVFPAYFGLAAAGSVVIAVTTRKKGVRWGAIVLFCLAIAILARLSVALLH